MNIRKKQFIVNLVKHTWKAISVRGMVPLGSLCLQQKRGPIALFVSWLPSPGAGLQKEEEPLKRKGGDNLQREVEGLLHTIIHCSRATSAIHDCNGHRGPQNLRDVEGRHCQCNPTLQFKRVEMAHLQVGKVFCLREF